MTGTTSRTLRHYGDIGLLQPSSVGAGGMRYYDRDGLTRLQRILLLRQLGLGLPAIADALDSGVGDVEALEAHRRWLRCERARLARQITAVDTTIAALNGLTMAGGLELAMACDLIVATRDATFAITPARMGVPYHTDGVAQFLGAVPLNVAKEMFFTAQPLAADSPHLAGTVNRLADDSASREALSRARVRCCAAVLVEYPRRSVTVNAASRSRRSGSV